MKDKAFLNGLANGKSDIFQKFLDILDRGKIDYCVIGGLAVNAFVEPVVSMDMDIVIDSSQIEKLIKMTSTEFKIEEFPNSINLNSAESDLRIQIQTDARYQAFLKNTEEREILGYMVKVASVEDILRGKIWAYSDEQRRKSKRQKDLADIFRIMESFPNLGHLLTEEIREKM